MKKKGMASGLVPVILPTTAVEGGVEEIASIFFSKTRFSISQNCQLTATDRFLIITILANTRKAWARVQMEA